MEYTIGSLKSTLSELSGSVKILPKYKGKSLNEIVSDSKKEQLSRYVSKNRLSRILSTLNNHK